MGTADGICLHWLLFFLCLTSYTRTPTRWKSVECHAIRYHHHHPHHHNNKWIIRDVMSSEAQTCRDPNGCFCKAKVFLVSLHFLPLTFMRSFMLREERQYSRQFFSFSFLKILTYLAERLKKRIRTQPPSWFLTEIHMIHNFQTTHPAGTFFFFSPDPLRPIFPKYTQLICNRECWIFMRKT